MRTIYNVTITETVSEKFDPKTQHRSLLENATVNPEEAVLARKFLENAPVGAQLHAYFHGKRLKYTNVETDEVITFNNTYVKYAEGCIAVKPIRHSLIGAGSFGQVKLLIDIQTGNHIVAKEFFTGEKQFQNSDRSQRLTSYYEKITRTQNLTLSFNGQISQGVVHKQRNPFKKLCQQTNAEPLDITYGDTTFSFHITPEQKAAEQLIADKKTSTKPNSKEETKPIIYFEYRGHDFISFLMEEQFLISDIPELPRIVQESLHILHNAIHCQNLLHRDLKPENLLLLRDKNTKRLSLYICDPDFVIPIDPTTKVAYSNLKGTAEYLPPEFYLFLSESFCRSKIRNQNILPRRDVAQRFANTLFPQAVNFQDITRVRFSLSTDIYSLGASWNYFFSIINNIVTQQDDLIKEKFRHLKKLIRLMAHYHPFARPDLILMQLAILPLVYDTLSEATLPAILEQQNLPNINLKNLKQLSECMIKVAENFDFTDPTPFYFLSWLYQYIKNKFITLENNERDFTQFIRFVCMLHENGPKNYLEFDKSVVSLDTFLERTNSIHDFIEKSFFNCIAAFTIVIQDKLALCWEYFYFIRRDREALSHFGRIIQHFAHANKMLRDTNQSNPIIYQEISHRIRSYIATRNTDINVLQNLRSNVDSLINIHASLKEKSIWEVISDAARSEKINETQLQLLFELAPHLYQKQFSLFRIDLLCLAVNIDNVNGVRIVTNFILSRRWETKSATAPELFQPNSEQTDKIYQDFFYCALINCIYLTTRTLKRSGDTQLESDLAKLTAFLENVRNKTFLKITPISDWETQEIRETINEFNDPNIFLRKSASVILGNASTLLTGKLTRRCTHVAAQSQAAGPALTLS